MVTTGILFWKTKKLINMEIGSFIELDLRNTGEYYSDFDFEVARLNSARSGIVHALRVLNAKTLYIPYYLCPSVSCFILKKEISLKYYNLNCDFSISIDYFETNSAILIVNYFGVFSNTFIMNIANKYNNVIVDNSAAFFAKPLNGYLSVYSPRKFFGVPDGCYVIGNNANLLTENYVQDNSSDTASFLFKRIEYGSRAVYNERMKNEERIDNSGILNMSLLTRKLLSNIDYDTIKAKRKKNFEIAHLLYRSVNEIDPAIYMDDNSIPMVYPLVIKNENIVEQLKTKGIYTGRWWKNVLNYVHKDSFEALLSRFMIPLPIDQRYGEKEIKFVSEQIFEIVNE